MARKPMRSDKLPRLLHSKEVAVNDFGTKDNKEIEDMPNNFEIEGYEEEDVEITHNGSTVLDKLEEQRIQLTKEFGDKIEKVRLAYEERHCKENKWCGRCMCPHCKQSVPNKRKATYERVKIS